MIIDTDHFWCVNSGELTLTTQQIAGVNCIKSTELAGGDIVTVAGDLWRGMLAQDSNARAVTVGDHRLIPIAYQDHQDMYFAICRPRR